MRKIIVLFTCVIMLGALYLIPLQANSVSVVVNGKALNLDVEPRIINGSVMVPFRAIGEALGAEIAWDGQLKLVTMTLDGKYAKLIIGDSNMTYGKALNNSTTSINNYTLPAPPQLIENYTFVPVRAISEGLGSNVGWDDSTKTVNIVSPEKAAVSEEYVMPSSINSRNELISAIGYNINELKKEFTIEINNYYSQEFDIALLDYFDNIESYSHRYITQNGKTTMTYKLDYRMAYIITKTFESGNTKDLSSKELTVYNQAKAIIDSQIKAGMNEYEKEKAIHDYIVLNTRYDEENYIKGTIPEDSYTPYGVLNNKTAVCEGYSQTFKMLLNMLGMECDVIVGTSNGQAHAWNRVKVEGEYYNVDITHNDPIPDMPGRVRYDYFNVTDNMLNVDHQAYNPDNIKATATKYNYHYYNGLVAANQAEFEEAVEKAVNTGVKDLTLRCEGISAYSLDLDAVFKYHSKSFTYSINENCNTIEIEF